MLVHAYGKDILDSDKSDRLEKCRGYKRMENVFLSDFTRENKIRKKRRIIY
jgi:hypothetical protein